jgi:hypothetical protein
MGILSRLLGRKSETERLHDVLRQFNDRFNYYECPKGCTSDMVLQTANLAHNTLTTCFPQIPVGGLGFFVSRRFQNCRSLRAATCSSYSM